MWLELTQDSEKMQKTSFAHYIICTKNQNHLLFSGLTIAYCCLDGEFSKMFAESQAAKNSIRQSLRDEGVKGFADVVVSTNVIDGISHV